MFHWLRLAELDVEMHVQDVAETLLDNVGFPPRRQKQPEKTQKTIKVVGLSKPKKVDQQMPSTASKMVGLYKPKKSVAKVGSSTKAEVA